MPQAYHIYKLKQFPVTDTFGTDDQLYLRIDHKNNLEDVRTSVVGVVKGFRTGVDQFEGIHDFLRRLKYPGRARNLEFDEFVSEYRFPVFVDRSSATGDQNLLVRTKGDIAKDFIDRLRKGVDTFDALDRQVHFPTLRPFLTFISGAWFADMRTANLSSAGMFGSHVDRSSEFTRAERLGTLRSLTVFYKYRDAQYHVMITSSGTVVVYDSFDTLEEELDLVLDIKRQLLDRCWTM